MTRQALMGGVATLLLLSIVGHALAASLTGQQALEMAAVPVGAAAVKNPLCTAKIGTVMSPKWKCSRPDNAEDNGGILTAGLKVCDCPAKTLCQIQGIKEDDSSAPPTKYEFQCKSEGQQNDRKKFDEDMEALKNPKGDSAWSSNNVTTASP